MAQEAWNSRSGFVSLEQLANTNFLIFIPSSTWPLTNKTVSFCTHNYFDLQETSIESGCGLEGNWESGKIIFSTPLSQRERERERKRERTWSLANSLFHRPTLDRSRNGEGNVYQSQSKYCQIIKQSLVNKQQRYNSRVGSREEWQRLWGLNYNVFSWFLIPHPQCGHLYPRHCLALDQGCPSYRAWAIHSLLWATRLFPSEDHALNKSSFWARAEQPPVLVRYIRLLPWIPVRVLQLLLW